MNFFSQSAAQLRQARMSSSVKYGKSSEAAHSAKENSHLPETTSPCLSRQQWCVEYILF
jgi:hypothetical protein